MNNMYTFYKHPCLGEDKPAKDEKSNRKKSGKARKVIIGVLAGLVLVAASAYAAKDMPAVGANVGNSVRRPQMNKSNCTAVAVDTPQDAVINTICLQSAEKNEVRLVANIPARRLYVFHNDSIVNSYRIVVGGPAFPTPFLKTKLLSITEDPVWYPPKKAWAAKYKGKPIFPDDPKNPLGAAKIKPAANPAVMLHGSKNEYGVSGNWSHGCMRMGNRDVKELIEYINDLGVKIKDVEFETVYVPVEVSYAKDHNFLLIYSWDNLYNKRINRLELIKDGLSSAGIDYDFLDETSANLIADLANGKKRGDVFCFRVNKGVDADSFVTLSLEPVETKTVFIQPADSVNQYYIYISDDQAYYISTGLYSELAKLDIPKKFNWQIYQGAKIPGKYLLTVGDKSVSVDTMEIY